MQPLVTCNLSGVQVQALVDTGYMKCFVSQDLFDTTKKLKKDVSDMLCKGVIQPRSSPWVSPIISVKKKEGWFRFCIDYREVKVPN